jgi:hypothetical protein
MSWDRILLNGGRPDETLRRAVVRLLDQQRDTWPAFGRGEAALAGMTTRPLERDGAKILVQLNAARSGSTLAKIDPAAIAARPCFLCPQNMPPEERGVPYRDLVILPNPFPVIPSHLTIPSREHTAQRLDGRLDDMLALAAELGPEMLVIYNGPGAGASAPDHFHFQAGSVSGLPLVGELDGASDPVSVVSSLGRQVLVLRGADAGRQADRLATALDLLREEGFGAALNLAAIHRHGRFELFLFPRRVQRPACFFREEPERIAVSPATLEMLGVLVVVDPKHAALIDAGVATEVYEEVCAERALLETLAEGIG